LKEEREKEMAPDKEKQVSPITCKGAKRKKEPTLDNYQHVKIGIEIVGSTFINEQLMYFYQRRSETKGERDFFFLFGGGGGRYVR
jgi:hypothetical protein